MTPTHFTFESDEMLTLLGWGVIACSFFLAWGLYLRLSKQVRLIWVPMLILIGVFALTYIAALITSSIGHSDLLSRLNSLILFCGSIFVFLSVFITKKMNQQIMHYVDNLESLIQERTLALKNANLHLKESHTALLASSRASALGTIAGGIAHEINTPLTSIILSCSRLEKDFNDETINRVEAQLLIDTIERLSFSIGEIINGLKTFSQESSNRKFSKVKMADALNDTITMYKNKAVSSGITLDISPVSPELTFSGIRSDITFVLISLIKNSIEALKHEESKWIKLIVSENDDAITIRITDSGCGISIENRDRVFEPFFTTKEIGENPGMGLSISLGILKSHSGSIKLDTHSQNTSFLIELPKHEVNVLKQPHPGSAEL